MTLLKQHRAAPIAADASPSLSSRWIAPALVLVVGLSACAADSWKPNQGVGSLLDRIDSACGTMRLGEPTVRQMITSSSATYAPYLVDQISRLDTGRISADDFVLAVSTGARAPRDSPAIRCMLAQKSG